MSSETSDQRAVRLSTMATRPSEPEHLPCPRCDSTNTKFCYYNNYNLSQPRHFCKSCRRYWTRGGTLRNVPVGGGSHKSSASSSHKRPRAITTASMSFSTTTTASTTSTPTGSSSSENMAHHDPLHGNPMSPMVHQIGSGSVPISVSLMGCEVNLNDAVPEASSFGSLLTTHVGAGLLPFGGGFGLGFGLGALDWPMEPLDHHGSHVNSNIGLGGGDSGVGGGGDGNDNGNSGLGSGGSSTGGGCNTWQMGGGVEGGLGDGDCFGWPELAISMPGKGLK